MPELTPEEAKRRADNARLKDAIFTSEESVNFDRKVVQQFDKVSQEKKPRDGEDRVMPDVPSTDEYH